MAKQTIIRLIDDLDQSEATRTIAFSWDGVAYEVDLSAKNARAFEQAVAPYLSVARRVPAGGRPTGRRAATPKLDLAAVRAWAIENGHKVAERGRIPGPVLDAFHAAQHAVADLGGTTAPTRPAAKAAAKRTAPRAARKAGAKRAGATTAAKRPARKAAKKSATKSAAKKATRRSR